MNENAFFPNSAERRAENYVVPEGVVAIGDDAFADWEDLRSIVIPEGVVSIGNYAFYNCVALESVVLPETLVSIGENAFGECVALKSIALPKNVKSIGAYAFDDCDSLESIVVPEGISEIKSGAFCGCASLKSIVLPDSVVSLGDYAFCGCRALTSIELPRSLASIGANAFQNCPKLRSVVVPSDVVDIGKRAFSGCKSLERIDVDEKNKRCRSIDGVLFSKDGKTLLKYPNDKKCKIYVVPESATTIENYAFEGACKATSIVLSKSVVHLNVESFDEDRLLTFYDCGSLKSIEVDDENPAFRSIDGVLFDKDATSLIFCPEANEPSCYAVPERVATIGNRAFARCSLLTTLVIRRDVKKIGRDAFFDCLALKSIDVGDENSRYRSIDGVLFDKDAKTLLLYPAARQNERYVVPEGVVAIGDRAFRNCRRLKEIVLPESVMDIGFEAFYGCSSAEKIVLPKQIDSIEARAFQNCSSLKEVAIPNGPTRIELEAFSGCSSLTEVVVPEGVALIREDAFERCSSLRRVVLPKSVEQIASTAFIYCKKMTILAPEGSYAERCFREDEEVDFEPVDRNKSY